MGIRAKLLLLFGLVAAVPMAVVAVASYRHSVRSVEILVEERARASLGEISDAVAEQRDAALQVLDVLASNQEIDDLYAAQGPADTRAEVARRVERFFGQILSRTPSPFLRVRYVDAQGSLLLRHPRVEGDGRSDDAGEAPPLARAGRLEVSQYSTAAGVQFTDEYDHQAGAVLRLAAPIRRLADGHPVGWALADIAATPLLKQVLSQQGGHDRAFVTENGAGRLIYHPTPTYLGQGLGQVNPAVADELASTSAVAGQFTITGDGGVHLVSWARLERPDWTVVTVEPQAPAAAAVRRAGAFNLAVTGAALTLAAVLILVAITRITGSIRRVTAGAQAIAAGDLNQQIEVASGDETRTLADAFNQMSVSLRDTLGKLQELNQELEGRVERRTRSLAERTADLEQANQSLEELNRDLALANEQVSEATRHKSEFLSRMSHDLRTPMNAIIGYTRILLRRARGALDERQLRNLENIETSADNLLNLINEILDLSRIEAGRIEVKPEPVDLGSLVRECITSVAPLVRPEVELAKEIDEIGLVTTDAERIRRVVMNLLGNAVKFTERGRITVSLAPADGEVQLSVADTGVGIPAADLPDIFQEFRQVERQVGEKKEGTGLGLAIAARSVEMLGGTISVESEVGEGTVFTVRLGDCREAG